MAEFLSAQLDYIFFFYGLAFILLGAVCFAIVRSGPREPPWAVLGSFGIVHGTNEWLDLLALSVGDAPALAFARLAIMAASYVLLVEFARLGAIRLGRKAPGRWIYGPVVLAVVLGGVTGGPSAVNAVVRYTLGLAGAMGAALVLALLSRELSGGERRWGFSAATGLVLYGIAAGVIVPAAPFWPAFVLNYDAFFRATGTPIQLLRGLLACWVAFSFWGFGRQQILLSAASPAHARKLSGRSVWIAVATVAILGFGWELIEYLGEVVRQDMQSHMKNDLDLLTNQLNIVTTTADDVAKSMAESPWLLPALGGGERARAEANTVADLSKDAAGGDGIAYLMDASGTVLASSNRWKSDSLVGKNYRFRPYFQQAIAGSAAYYYALGVTTGERGYYASHPVRDKAGRIVGVAVIKKPLDPVEVDLGRFNHFFLIDPHGVVFLASEPDMLFKTLWPLPAESQLALSSSRQFGNLRYAPLLEREITDGTWVVFKGERHYAGRRYTGQGGWSFVELKTARAVAAGRLFGITITLICTLIGLTISMYWLFNMSEQNKTTIAESENRLKTIMESVQTGIVIIEPDTHKIVYVNSTAASMIGAPKEEIVGSVCHKFICPADMGKCPITDLHQIVDHSERVLLMATGARRPIIKSVATVLLGGKKHLLESYIDITELKRMEELLHASLAEKEMLVQSLNELAIHDGLTGLYNHHEFYVLLGEELARATRFNRSMSLLMLDIDHFKRVNDTHGHQAGDAILKELSDLLGKQARAIDRACRYGGEEITIILPETTSEHAVNAAERIRAAIESHAFEIGGGKSLTITVSIGVATFPDQADTPQTLVTAADKALYAAKQAGRNRVCCEAKPRPLLTGAE